MLLSEHATKAQKDTLTAEYQTLDPVNLLVQLEGLQDAVWKYSRNKNGNAEPQPTINTDVIVDQGQSKPVENAHGGRYYHTNTKPDLRKAPRTWRTRKDPFENVWDEVRLRLELTPETTAKAIVEWLMSRYLSQFLLGQTRTLQRRIAE